MSKNLMVRCFNIWTSSSQE